jgi:nicotinamidase/pyrazinamidase
MDVLILVDIQNDFLPGGALAVPAGHDVISVANRLAHTVDLVVATQDWHPPKHMSFAVNHPGRRPFETIPLADGTQTLWPVHCVQFTGGACFAPHLDTSRIERVFPKGSDPAVDSYSGFFDNRRRHSTGLGEFLRDRGVRTAVICGLATDYCVRATALDALGQGLTVRVIEEGCRAVNIASGDAARAISEMREAGVEIA